MAAVYSNTETLQLLLEHYDIALAENTPLHQRDFSVLNVACYCANVEAARCLLASQLAPATLSEMDQNGYTPLTCAAASLAILYYDGVNESEDGFGWRCGRIKRVEETISFLLDIGASAAEVVPDSDVQSSPLYTMLSLAASRRSYSLISRLLNQGADLYAKQQCMTLSTTIFSPPLAPELPHDATALHWASLYRNAGGLQAMLDYHSSHRSAEDTITRFVSTRDNYERLPLHCAAMSPHSFDYRLPDDVVSGRIAKTFTLLLASAPETINIPDAEGMTPLHHAVKSGASYGESTHAVAQLPIRFLLENGADTSVSNIHGQTALDLLFENSPRGELVNTALLELLVSHGAPINHPDQEGNTPLHIIASSLNQVQTIKFLIALGADVKATNLEGDTVFHVAAIGELIPPGTSHGTVEDNTVEDKIRAQDQLMAVLQDAAGTDDIMDQANAEGTSPRYLCAETRCTWWRVVAAKQGTRGDGCRRRAQGTQR